MNWERSYAYRYLRFLWTFRFTTGGKWVIAGLIMSGVGLLLENTQPTEEDVRFAIGGNLCRCTGYSKVVQAILKAAETMRATASS